MADQEVKDITIIGGGAAGLYAAFYAGMRDLSVRIIELNDKLGGMIHFYPEKIVWDVGGIPPVSGAELIGQMVKQGLTFEPEILLNEQIKHVKKAENGFFISSGKSGRQYISKKVIIATGSGIYKPKKLSVKDAKKFERQNLHYAIQHLEDFKGKQVVIVGGGNSAVDWANELETVAEKVQLIHRNGQFRAHESQIKQLEKSAVQIHTHTEVKKIVPNASGNQIAAIIVKNNRTNEEQEIKLDQLIANIGIDSEQNFYHDKTLGIELEDHFYIKGSVKTNTNIKGLYACGDVLNFDGKVRLIAGAFTDAANAINQIKQALEPNASEKANVSSHNQKFTEKNRQIRARLYQ